MRRKKAGHLPIEWDGEPLDQRPRLGAEDELDGHQAGSGETGPRGVARLAHARLEGCLVSRWNSLDSDDGSGVDGGGVLALGSSSGHEEKIVRLDEDVAAGRAGGRGRSRSLPTRRWS